MGRLCARKRKGEMDKLQHEIKGGGQGVGMGYNVNVISYKSAV